MKQYRNLLIGLLGMGTLVYAYWIYEDSKDIIAKVGQFEIRKKEFQKEMLYRGGNHLAELDRKALLEEMILKKLLLNKAYDDGLPDSQAVQREYNHLLMGIVRKQYIEAGWKRIVISQSELSDFYNENKSLYHIPQKRHLAILFFKKRRKDSEVEKRVVMEKFDEILTLSQKNKLPQATKGFGSYAIDYSEHQVSRYRGGELGWFREENKLNWEQKVLDEGFKLRKVGDVSQMVETDKGYYLVRLMGTTKAYFKLFKDVKSQVKHKLMIAKQKQLKEDFYTVLKSEFQIDKDIEKLDDLNISVSSIKEKRPPMGSM